MSHSSIDSLSFDLANHQMELPSQSLIESPLTLEYSLSRLSIAHLLNAEPTFSIRIQHDNALAKQTCAQESRSEAKSSHVFQLSDGLKRCFGPHTAGAKPIIAV